MPTFLHPLWGYELSYPENWVHETTEDGTEVFGPDPALQEANDLAPEAVQLLIRSEWNSTGRSIGPIWNQHVAMAAGMMGAKKVGSAPWRMGGGIGIEAEIALPKHENLRLWTGILTRGWIVLKFSVTHIKEERSRFEPIVTRIISSLKFIDSVSGLVVNGQGLPVPPAYTAVDPLKVISDIANPDQWVAYDGGSGIDALQCFYARELENYGWAVQDYIPFPGTSSLGFARLELSKNEQTGTLGLLPFGKETVTPSSPAKIVFKLH